VTSSVAIAGVLLVFCYLIVPSVGAMLLLQIGRRFGHRLTMGTLVSRWEFIFRYCSICPQARPSFVPSERCWL